VAQGLEDAREGTLACCRGAAAEVKEKMNFSTARSKRSRWPRPSPPAATAGRLSQDGDRLKKRPDEPAQALRLDTGDAALADFEDAMLAGNEVEIDVSDGLAIDAHGALPHQPARLIGRGGEAELL
jgi:hypothetical protein